MSKELTPLEAFEELFGGVKFSSKDIDFDKLYAIVEIALREHEEYKSILKDFSLENPQNLIDNLNIIKNSNSHKKLKAWKIVASRLGIARIKDKYIMFFGEEEEPLIKEEHDLIQEVLMNEED